MTRHRIVWLEAHPWRTKEWLAERLKNGFEIHHIDGKAWNNVPANLVLIDASDHRLLHGGLIPRLPPKRRLPRGHRQIMAEVRRRNVIARENARRRAG